MTSYLFLRDNEPTFFVDFAFMSIPQETTQLFNQALALQQQQKIPEAALEAYQKILTLDLNTTQASVIYHNMSTIAHEKGNALQAYVWSKKSLTLNPRNQLAQDSLKEFIKKFEVPQVPRQITNFDNFKAVISTVPVDAWFILSLVLVFATMWLVLKKFITDKKNQLAHNFITTPKWPVYLIAPATVLTLFCASIRYLDSTILRGLIIAEKAPIQTAPGENKSVIFEAPAGLELQILKFDQGYYLIRYPGAFSGWISSSQLEILGLNFKHTE